VISLEINPPFAGNLLVQASGRTYTGELPNAVACAAYVGSTAIGEESQADLSSAASVEPVTVTGATTVAAGPQTVSVKCEQSDTTLSTGIGLTIFALVTG
jgi:hypothetical protein